MRNRPLKVGIEYFMQKFFFFLEISEKTENASDKKVLPVSNLAIKKFVFSVCYVESNSPYFVYFLLVYTELAPVTLKKQTLLKTSLKSNVSFF